MSQVLTLNLLNQFNLLELKGVLNPRNLQVDFADV